MNTSRFESAVQWGGRFRLPTGQPRSVRTFSKQFDISAPLPGLSIDLAEFFREL